MSLGIKQEPDSLMPIGNPLPLVVDSSQSGVSNFRYRLRINRVYGAAIYLNTAIIYLDPDINNSGYMVYDLGQIIANYVESDPEVIKIEDITVSNPIQEYQWNVTEYVGNTAGSTISNSIDMVAFDGVTQYTETWDELDYIPHLTNECKFLTNKVNRTLKMDSYSVVNMVNKDLSEQLYFVIKVYDPEASTTIKYYQNTITAPTYPEILTLPLGPVNLNAGGNNGDWLYIYGAYTGDIISPGTTYYDFYVTNAAGGPISETKRVYIDHNCYKEDGVTFIYKGELGTYETLIANFVDVKGFKTNFTEIKSDYYQVNSSDQFTYTKGDRGRKVVHRTTQESHKVNTDWLNDSESADLMELFNSNDVYIQDGTDILPIMITNSSYVQKTVVGQRLFNYTIKFEMAYNKLSV